MTVKRARVNAASSISPIGGCQRRIPGLANHKAYEQFQQFKLWPKRAVNYNKINKNITFQFIMRDVGLEAYNMHNHQPTANEIVWEFYAHVEPLVDNQPAFLRVRGRLVTFKSQYTILNAIPIKDIPMEHPLVLKMVSQIPTGTLTFQEMCANLTDCRFNTRYLKSSLLKKDLILIFLFSKYNILASYMTMEV